MPVIICTPFRAAEYNIPGPFTSIYITNGGDKRVFAIDGTAQTADGASAITRTIDGFGITWESYGIAYDKTNDRLFVHHWDGGISIYDNASTVSGQDPADRLVDGVTTLLDDHPYMYYDSGRDEIYMAGTTGILVFANAATMDGNIAPTRHIQYAGEGFIDKRIYLDLKNDRMYYLDSGGTALHIFDNMNTLDGAVTPDRSITCNMFSFPWGLTVDVERDIAYVGDQMGAYVLVFDNASTMNGLVVEDRTITGLTIGLAPSDLTIDAQTDTLWVLNNWTYGVHVYNNASTATGAIDPDRRITHTGFNYLGAITGVE